MKPTCLTCVHRTKESKEFCYRDKIYSSYRCDISRTNHGVIWVSTDHRACQDYSPNPFHYMRWHQVKKVVEVADRLLEKAKTEQWNQETYYKNILQQL